MFRVTNHQVVAPVCPIAKPTLGAMTQDCLPSFIKYATSALGKFSGQRGDKPPGRGTMKAWHLGDVQSTLAGRTRAALTGKGMEELI